MTLGAAIFAVIGFALVARGAGLVRNTGAVFARTQDAVGIMRSRELDDEEKEKALQRHALGLFGLLGKLVLGSAAALGAPLALVWLLEAAGVLSLAAVLDTLVEPRFLVAATAIGFAVHYLGGRIRA